MIGRVAHNTTQRTFAFSPLTPPAKPPPLLAATSSLFPSASILPLANLASASLCILSVSACAAIASVDLSISRIALLSSASSRGGAAPRPPGVPSARPSRAPAEDRAVNLGPRQLSRAIGAGVVLGGRDRGRGFGGLGRDKDGESRD